MGFLRENLDSTWQFHTYTLRHSQAPLCEQLDRLVHAFRRLRNRQIWKRACSAGYAVVEITFHPSGTFSPNGRTREHDEWHPHLHVLVQTNWLDWSALHKAWRDITQDSTQIDCKHVKDLTTAARYITKYVGKPATLDLASSPDRAREYYRSINHRRLLLPFGPAAKHPLPPPPPARPSTYVCKLHQLHTAALAGCYPAQCMITFIALAMKPRFFKPTQTPDPLLPFERKPP